MASTKPMKVRLQWNGGQKVVSLEPGTSFGALRQLAHEASGVPLDGLRLLAGFPPQPLDLDPDGSLEGKIRTGDTVVIEGAPAPVTAAQAAEIIGSKPAEPAKRKRARKGGGLFKSEEGIAEQMVAAGGRKGQDEDLGVSYLRDALKFALSHVQSETLANFRYRAAMGRQYEFEPVQAFRLGDGSSGRYNVKFKGERAWKCDKDVELVEKEALRAVYQMVLDEGGEAAREHLKPFKMAQISPRCFWSLVYHFEGEVAQGLQTLLPEHDWSFLNERARKKSDKALENEAQQARAEAEKLAESAAREERKRQKTAGPGASE